MPLVRTPTRRVVVLLACVLGLENADAAAVGAAAPQLESALHISNTQLGLLAAISTFVGALVTIPMGALTDRVKRTQLLAVTVVAWGLAMAAGATAQSYEWLLLSRLGLGAVIAAAGPMVASLTGDFFAPGERGRIYGYILSGELLGGGVGFAVSGTVASALSWRAAFVVLAVPALILAYAIRRALPEPPRRARPESPRHARPERPRRARPERRGRAAGRDSGGDGETARPAVRSRPDPSQVLTADAQAMPIGRAVRYVLSIATNRWLIAASVVGYFFLAGLRTFALVFVRGQFALSQSAATVVLFTSGLGALAGVLLAGRLADRLIRAGRVDARLLVAAASYILAAVVLVPAMLITSLALAVPLLMLGAATLAAPNPPLDAARLDIMPARLWGRAEGVRSLLRQVAQAAAPILFGLVADLLASGTAGTLGTARRISPGATQGLQYSFLIMLVPLATGGACLLTARRTYPTDMATALASERQT
jgi:predicted MFS family arabinose efflux permease